MRNFIKKRLHEELNIPSFRLPKNILLSRDELSRLKALKWSDIKIEDNGGEGNIAHLSILFPFPTQASEGIVIDIQVIHGAIYQVHIHMIEQLRGMGLGYNIYKALIADLGHIYSGRGRRMSPYITKIWDKLHTDNEISCITNENGDLCMRKDNPDKENLVKFMN